MDVVWLATIALGMLGLMLLVERFRRTTHAMAGGLHEDISLPHEQAWELYHNDFSLCSKKTRVCLAELGIDYRSHRIDLIETGAYENLSRRFLKINPAALVPVLVHEGHPIYESHDQLAYAAAHSGRSQVLTPEDPQQQALMGHWVRKTSLIGENPLAALEETAGNAVPGLTLPIFAAMIEHIPVWRIFVGLLFHRFPRRPLMFLVMKARGLKRLPSIKPMMTILQSSRTAMRGHLDELEAALIASGGPWILGERFSSADVGMMVILDRLREVDWLDVFLTEQRPNIAAYWQALKQRPSYAAGISAFEHPTVTRGLAAIKHLKAEDPDFAAVWSG
ncbi:MAG: glutathione S-transferase family protein [Gammaproteobacteria bacterium]|nr:glutathione S-transferase family protein [Gammaproteobacteria bacterium]